MLRHTGRITPRHFKIREAWAHLVENGHSRPLRTIRDGYAALLSLLRREKAKKMAGNIRFSADGDLMNKPPENGFLRNAAVSRQKAEREYEPFVIKYRHAVARNPKNTYAQYQLATALGNSGDIKGALECFNKVIEQNSLVYKAYFRRGFCRFILGDKKGAIEDFQLGDLVKKRLSFHYMDEKIRQEVDRIMTETMF